MTKPLLIPGSALHLYAADWYRWLDKSAALGVNPLAPKAGIPARDAIEAAGAAASFYRAGGDVRWLRIAERIDDAKAV